MDEIIVRLAYKEDLKGMYAVEKSSFVTPWSYEAFSENFYNESSVYAAAEIKEYIIGFAGVQIVADEAHIMNVAVLKNFRRMGAADKIIKLIKKEAKQRGAAVMYLEVRKSNIAAQSLYCKHNFRVLGIRKKYYSDNDEDAIVMSAEL